MQRNVLLTDAERGYFAELFDEDIQLAPAQQDGLNHMISVTTEVPQLIASLLGKATFTLLAEVGNYKLWFPLEMSLDEFGQPSPVLGIPEVLEYCGAERSWRLQAEPELCLNDTQYAGKVKVLSLSSSGMALLPDNVHTAEQLMQTNELTLSLPDGQLLRLGIEPVRRENNILATRISACKQNRDTLRRYLFQRHRQRHPALYQGLS
jgi:hypothetical protein